MLWGKLKKDPISLSLWQTKPHIFNCVTLNLVGFKSQQLSTTEYQNTHNLTDK